MKKTFRNQFRQTRAVWTKRCEQTRKAPTVGRNTYCMRFGMKTGLDVQERGWYASECCNEEVLLEKDQTFPRCWICKDLTRWDRVESPEQVAA